MSNKKDIRLLQNLRGDVKGSYSVLYREYFGMIQHFVSQNSGSPEDSSDLFQDTVVALFEMVQRHDFKLKSKLSTLIYSIARNLWLKKLRDENSKKLRDSEAFYEIDTDYDEEKDEKIEKLEHAVEAMGDPCKSILIGFYFLKKKMAELAKEMNYETANHAKAQKYKCLQRLKKMVLSP